MHSRVPVLASLVLLVATTLTACGDDKSKTGAAPSATASAAAPTEPAPPPKPKTMPALIVDSLGPYIGQIRVDMKQEKWPEKLTAAVKDLPINGQQVTVIAEKKARTPDVAAVVAELGRAGAPTILLKTDGRDDVPKELLITPPDKVSNPPGCSVTVMVLKDLSTAVWPFKGGLGKKQRKGFAGPDLSNTGDAIKKDLAICDSSFAFFSADDTVSWEMAYNLAGTLKVVDEKSDKKKIETLVLLGEAPVAGRPVTLKK
ncbi:biopolymer transporter ExbD [Polyangium mundeleinium]|uniref:Biopolymer transporter ExbD n=1 Tax=Polyangium mundeleinium TaxID=2995306 RepID=A0ABT5F8B1_9BACT|nr:biopolymer transporter ExbD [Polyangium mundeleinium]MDC0749904.1 biopolymer transporter ExbD [Polyangium mundeleinium]